MRPVRALLSPRLSPPRPPGGPQVGPIPRDPLGSAVPCPPRHPWLSPTSPGSTDLSSLRVAAPRPVPLRLLWCCWILWDLLGLLSLDITEDLGESPPWIFRNRPEPPHLWDLPISHRIYSSPVGIYRFLIPGMGGGIAAAPPDSLQGKVGRRRDPPVPPDSLSNHCSLGSLRPRSRDPRPP